MLKVLGKSKEIVRGRPLQCLILRFLTAVPDTVTEDKSNEPRRFFVARKAKQLKSCNQNFVSDLFAGKFDKNIFRYPNKPEANVIDNLLLHSTELETYLRKSKECTEVTKDILNALKSLELFGLSAPQKYGGLEYTEAETIFLQECANADPLIGRLLACNINFGVKLLTLYGSSEQKSKYLTKIASGEILTSLALLENSPIIEVNNINTSATYDLKKKCFVVNGKKQYVVNANIADVFAVIAVRKKVSEIGFESILNLLLIDKNTPGITVRRLTNSKIEKQFGLFEVIFNNVIVPEDNLIGPKNESSFMCLKHLLSLNQLSASASCLSSLKFILHSVLSHCDVDIVNEALNKEQGHMHTNIGNLTSYIYVLESVIYMIAGRFDDFEHPDLFLESSIAKILAVDFLHLGIKKYIEVLGNESYKSPSLLQHVLEVLYYYTIMDENHIHLKLLVASSGIVEAISSSSQLRENVNTRRNPLFSPVKALKLFSAARTRIKRLKTYNFKMELNSELRECADILEEALIKLHLAVENHLTCHGNKASSIGYHNVKLAEMAAYVYALTACLSRASNSFCDNVINSGNEINIVRGFSAEVKMQMDLLFDEVVKFMDYPEAYDYIAKCTFQNKQYPVEHPLSRTF